MNAIKQWLHSAFVIHLAATLKGVAVGLLAASAVGFETGQFQLSWHSYAVFAVATLVGILKKNGNGWLIGPGTLTNTTVAS